jgi:hypothetical protein
MMMMMMALFIYFSSKEDKTLKKRARKALFSFVCLFFSFFYPLSLADDLSLVFFQFFSFSLSPSPPHHPIVTLLFITLYEKRD